MKKRLGVIGAAILIYLIYRLIFMLPVIYQYPSNTFKRPREKIISTYYTINDENSAVELMRVPVTVEPGDEVLSADNKLYQVVRVEGNQAYARFIKQVKL